MNTYAHAPVPRLLLVEDDTISLSFLQNALELLPAQVDSAESIKQAMELAAVRRHDLWLIDVNLPDGSGEQLLQRLRTLHPGVPALAHTADNSPELHQRLKQEGFRETLRKPFGREQLLRAIRRTLAQGGGHASLASDESTTDWDETAALAALNGQRNHLVALRELFMAELPIARDAVSVALAQDDCTALRGQLHRLQASCGFVGAARLGRAVRQLHQDPASPMARNQFSEAVSALLH
jgi:CheY-like chemotaxis protein